MTETEWIDAVARAFARTMPDEFPEGYAYWLAGDKARRGAYQAFLDGAFGDDKLYEPNAAWN